MSQLHFSVDERTAERLREQARRAGVSLSQYLASLISQVCPPEWPQGYLDTVVGSVDIRLEEPPDLPLHDVKL